MDDRAHRAAHRIEGRSAAPGIALGPLVRLAPAKHDVRQYRSAAEERRALADALAASQGDLSTLARKAGDADAEAILSFQIALLEDDNLAAPAFALIAGGEVAHRAWSAAMAPEIASYDGAEDAYFRARASDLRDLRDRVLRHLAGVTDQTVPPGVIVAADDMPPVELYRVNGFQTLLKFRKRVDVTFQFDFGLLGHTGCRTRDAFELKSLGLS